MKAGNPKRQKAKASSPVRNDILRALLNSEYRRLRPKLERVALKGGEIVYRADQEIEYVYFPEDAVVAMIDTLDDGSTVEVGIIGHEGMVGINIFLGCLITPDKAIVQVPGSALRMKTKDLRKAIRFGSPLQRLLLRYTQALLAVISQSVACSQHHMVPQRLARWFLTIHDYAESNEFEMTHETVAAMLGTRRSGVTEAAGELQAAGLIVYTRGKILILDEAGLKRRSCECYRYIRQQFEALLKDVPKFLSAKAK
jgi:CRP-like cAMP-binding protein